MHARLVSFSILATLAFGSSLAAAQDPVLPAGAEPTTPAAAKAETFGRKGQLAIIAGSQLAAQRHSYAEGTGGTTIGLTPAVDYFLIDHLSIGARAGVEFTTIDASPPYHPSSSFHTYFVSPRVGYELPLGSSVSIWPSANVLYSVGDSAPANPGQRNRGLGFGASLPVLVHLAPHFFVGAGPEAGITWYRFDYGNADYSVRYASYGVTTLLGGWI
jgi:hypothetical protein